MVIPKSFPARIDYSVSFILCMYWTTILFLQTATSFTSNVPVQIPLFGKRQQQQQQLSFQKSQSTSKSRPAPSSTTTSLYVFERMSEDAISAIVTAQRLTNQQQLEYVDRQAMFAGCVDHPESRPLERTFQQYRISWRLIDKTFKLIHEERDNGKENSNNNNAGWLSGFRSAKATDGDTDRPFSKELKQTFTEAGKIASQMKSTTVSVQHIVLALLEYKPQQQQQQGGSSTATTPSSPTAYDSVYNTATDSPWYLIKKMNAVDDDVTPLTICTSLIKNIENDELTSVIGDGRGGGKELVSGTGGSTKSKTPTLEDFGTDLTQEARDGLLDPVYGRDDEIRSCVRTLIRRRKNNVCLIGEPGVGKTAIAEGVAQILSNDALCPKPLMGYRLISIELSSLVAGTRYRGEFEERLQSIITEVTNPKSPPTILFIDEIHNLIGAGSASEGGTMDAANILKPALARGQMQIIGATTISEYRKHIEKDAALERRLQPLMIKEPTIEQTIQILQAVITTYERHHNVVYTQDAIKAAAQLSERYITDRFLPDKAFDLLDEAGAITQLEFLEQYDNFDGLDNENDDDSDNESSTKKPIVTEQAVATIMSEWSGIPIGKIEANEMDRLIDLENELQLRVKGQGRAIRGVARAIRRARSGLRDPKRPVASFLFCGPTGTGKTELCKTLASTYYGNEKDMIRIDMSEYMEKHTVARLTGPPPGYIGYDAGGQLTEAVRRSPHSVVLFDEIEKAHEDVLNILLQLMDDGILTDGKGRTVNFKNTVIVMTSNVGSRQILDIIRANAAYRYDTNSEYDHLRDTLEEKMKETKPITARTKSATLSTKPNVVKKASTSGTVTSTPKANGANTNNKPATTTTTTTAPVSSIASMQGMTPDELFKRIQENPKAATVMMKAASNPSIMNAFREVAMSGGSQQDQSSALIKAAQNNPAITQFLNEVWQSLGTDEITDNNNSSNGVVDVASSSSSPSSSSSSSGLGQVRQSLQDTMSQWDETATSKFTTEVIDQLEAQQQSSYDINYDYNDDDGDDDEDTVDHVLYPELISVVKEGLEGTMRPEFLNRIDEIVVFSPLSKNNLRKIARLTIEKIINRAMIEHTLDELIVESTLIDKVMNEGSANAEQYGARPMRRAAQRYIEDSLSDAIVSGFFTLPDGTSEKRITLSYIENYNNQYIDKRDRVAIQRLSDNKIIEIRVEDASGGIGTLQSTIPRSLPTTTTTNDMQETNGLVPQTETIV